VRFGQQVNLGMQYHRAPGYVRMWAMSDSNDPSKDFLIRWRYEIPGQLFTKVRIGSSFGSSPWDASYAYTPPASPVKVATYLYARIASFSVPDASLSRWVHHKLLAQPPRRDLVASPHNLTHYGDNFQTWFVPKSAPSSS
jgi:hypothetical protein